MSQAKLVTVDPSASTGDVPHADGAGGFAWAPGSGAVGSVNGHTGVVVLAASDVGAAAAPSAPPADQTASTSGIKYHGGVLKVVYEVLNAHASGDLDPTSTADQSAGMTSFVSKVVTAQGAGYIPRATNANGYYNMGGTTIPMGSGAPCSIFGDQGSRWSWAIDGNQSGTVLKWTADTASAPETVAGIGGVNHGQRLSDLTLIGPKVYANTSGHTYGRRPAAMAGVQLLSRGTLERLQVTGFGAGVLLGASGVGCDHYNVSRIGMTDVGFGFFRAKGITGTGDEHYDHIQVADALLAAIGISNVNVNGGMQGGNLTECGFYGPYGVMGWDDGRTGGAWTLFAGMNMLAANVEAPGNGAIFDEVWGTTNGGSVYGNLFSAGILSAPMDSWGRTWTDTFSVTGSTTNTITVSDTLGGFVFRPGQTVTGTGIPANTTILSVSGTWPSSSYTLTLSNSGVSSPTSVVVTAPRIGTIVCTSFYNNQFAGPIYTSGAAQPFIVCSYSGKLTHNTATDAEGAFSWATTSGPTNSLTQSGIACAAGGSGTPSVWGNRWGVGDGGGTKITTVVSGAAIAANDLVMGFFSGGRFKTKPATGSPPVGQVLGVAQQTVANDFTVDVVCAASNITAHNKSGTNAIASGVLVYPDATNAGGISSTPNGPAIGVSNAAIAVSSTGAIQLFAS